MPLDDARPVLDAQARLDALTNEIYTRTWHLAGASQVASEPVNQLFHHRLVTPGHPDEAGGRAKRFSGIAPSILPDCGRRPRMFEPPTWVVNGTPYRDSIDVLLTRSRALLEPSRLAAFGAVTAHGDAHNANVWWDVESPGGPQMVFFDPAFAGNHISALSPRSRRRSTMSSPPALAIPRGPCDAAVSRQSHAPRECDRDRDGLGIESAARRLPRHQSRATLETSARTTARAERARPGLAATLRCALFCLPTW